MKILWISCLAWLENGEYRLPVNGPGAVSGSIFQQSIIEGVENHGAKVEILNDYPVANKRCVKGAKWSHNCESLDKTVSTINIPLISMIVKSISIFLNIFKKQKGMDYSIAIAYLIHTPYLIGLWIAKKIKRDIKTVLICPDLPGYMDMSLKEKPIKKLFKKIDYMIINKLMNSIDAFVLFSDSMKERLPIGNKPSIVIEGVYSPFDIDLTKAEKKRAIMHAGTLHRNIGIENIIEAFKLISDKELELWIFGDGDLGDYIRKASQIDKRIKFFGFVSRQELFEYEKRAMLLINTRNPNDEYTKYSFPSKTFEYMASGTPFLTTKLQGIPEEYYKYLYTIESNEPSVIAKNIKKIFEISNEENECFGLNAREFVLTNKNKIVQSDKLYKFLKSLL